MGKAESFCRSCYVDEFTKSTTVPSHLTLLQPAAGPPLPVFQVCGVDLRHSSCAQSLQIAAFSPVSGKTTHSQLLVQRALGPPSSIKKQKYNKKRRK
jgi:hypothetical protein